jgi:hypothetical protein
MFRLTARTLDKTRAPTKVYKYGYQPDPRKFAPVEIPRYEELFPRVMRPPCAAAPDTDTFLEKIDIHEVVPMADFKTAFSSWDELMKSRPSQNRKVRGMSEGTARWLAECVDDYRNGRPPQHFDIKDEDKYFKQFKLPDRSRRRIPELPEKYRPHQLGQEVRPQLNHKEANRQPEWAVKEEERLKAAGFTAPK